MSRFAVPDRDSLRLGGPLENPLTPQPAGVDAGPKPLAVSGSLDMDQDGQHVPVQDRAIWTSLVSSSSKVRCRGARNAHRSGPLRAFYLLRRRTAAVSREQLREGSALSNHDFDSTPA